MSNTLSARQRFCETAIYARLSKDRSGLSENVKIQIVEAQAYAEDEVWPVVGVFKDNNDISASRYSKKPRDDYQRLLGSIQRGEVNIILITEMPRLYRRLEELLDLIKLAETTQLRRIQTTDGISYDFSTAEGIHATINAVNNGMLESARTSKRIKRKQRKRAQDGLVHSGGRPYGYEANGVTVRESEAEIIRECAGPYTAGESIRDFVRDLNARGVPTTTGVMWQVSHLQRTIFKKRYIGVREYEGQDYPAVWPAILTVEQRERVEVQRIGRAAKGPKGKTGSRKYLLTGFIFCGRCGGAMVGNGRTRESGQPVQMRYRCRRTDNYGRTIGCGKTFRAAEPLGPVFKGSDPEQD
ncbi:recombinase family protein [Kitasatospora indigofera]|uniref:recombinase family protein n=1 Tax=Kitasatospora indigofera TaxID=67307 RepID=UPI0033ACE65E